MPWRILVDFPGEERQVYETDSDPITALDEVQAAYPWREGRALRYRLIDDNGDEIPV